MWKSIIPGWIRTWILWAEKRDSDHWANQLMNKPCKLIIDIQLNFELDIGWEAVDIEIHQGVSV